MGVQSASEYFNKCVVELVALSEFLSSYTVITPVAPPMVRSIANAPPLTHETVQFSEKVVEKAMYEPFERYFKEVLAAVNATQRYSVKNTTKYVCCMLYVLMV